MEIRPFRYTIEVLFNQSPNFEVPKYQRGYAWDDDAIGDFIEDLCECHTLRVNENSKNHFFGGIVAASKNVPNSNQPSYEVIDGQQRLASFVMMVAAINECMNEIVSNLKAKDHLTEVEAKAKAYMKRTIKTNRQTYLVFRDNIDLEYVDVPKLRLSEVDNEYFWLTLEGYSVGTSARTSHELIHNAWRKLKQFVNSIVDGYDSWEQAKRLQKLIKDVLGKDCHVILILCDKKSEAYQLFQVLNDRGVNLSDGDLLRARTMEELDSDGFQAIQDALALKWDSVLSYNSNDIDSYLRWYYSSYEGQRPKSSNLANQFIENRFKWIGSTQLGEEAAESILAEVKQMDMDFDIIDTMVKGSWPYTSEGVTTRWDKERLRLLTQLLDHTNAAPLLLALSNMHERDFSNAVTMIERSVFRYKTIGNVHIGPLSRLYIEYARKIRDSTQFSLTEFQSELRELVISRVPDSVFKANLMNLEYSNRGGNKDIRYMLITIEDYYQWYDDGAVGIPMCSDQTRVFDFGYTTLEHVYPSNAKEDEIDSNLEVVKNTIGNLTILAPPNNASLGNSNFDTKRSHFRNSNLLMNRKIAENQSWTKRTVQDRSKELIELALKVFVP